MTFNAATFFDTTDMSDAQAKRLEQRDDIDHLPRVAMRPALDPKVGDMVDALRTAALRFEARRDSFAQGKGLTCRDIADKLVRFGTFASDKQEDFARKLVEWSLPRQPQQQAQAAPGSTNAAPVVPAPQPAPVVRLERLFDAMQRLAKLRLGDVTIARKNQDSLCWVKWAGHEQVVGRIDGGVLTVFAARLRGITVGEVVARLRVIDLDPKAAAAAHGQASGNCSICGRDLTDPDSIALGIGPVCIETAGW